MRIEEFSKLMKKVAGFKLRLEQQGIKGKQAEIILKIYIQDLTDRINTNFLRKVI